MYNYYYHEKMAESTRSHLNSINLHAWKYAHRHQPGLTKLINYFKAHTKTAPHNAPTCCNA